MKRCVRSVACNMGFHGACSGCGCPCHNPGWPCPNDQRPFGRLRYELRRVRHLRAVGKHRWRVTLRAWYWRFVKRYECEICQDCGCGLDLRYGPSYWMADDALWLETVGADSGVLCIRCFTIRCSDLGISLRWRPFAAHREPSARDSCRKGMMP